MLKYKPHDIEKKWQAKWADSNIYKTEMIFAQEGWHYEKEGDNLIYNGVVFNEMKGASSSVSTLITNHLKKMVLVD